MKAEELLYILGNPTRREILQLLAERTSYVSEIAEELEVGQKAILEHLELMEEAGILEPKYQRIEKGRPRKYFAISKNFMLEINLHSNHFDVDIQTTEIRREGGKWAEEREEKEREEIDSALLEEFPSVKKIVQRLEKFEETGESEEELRLIKDALVEEREKLTSIKKTIDYLLNMISEAFE